MAQSKAQKETTERVMHEFKEGELETGAGEKVTNPKQAIAIALHEAGSTNRETPKKNRQTLTRTKAKERAGRTAEAEKEGKAAQQRTMAKATSKGRAHRGGGPSRAELYEEAKKRDVPGRSKMSKDELQRAIAH